LCGLTHEDVWFNLKPYQVIEYIKRYREKELEQLQIQCNLQHNLLWGIYYAVHNPKKLSTKPIEILTKKNQIKPMTEEELCLAIDAL
jgi:hypothetical protein